MDRRQVAERLLAHTSVKALQQTAATRPRWALVVRGFRPGKVSRKEFATKASQFAHDEGLLSELLALCLSERKATGNTLQAKIAHALEDDQTPAELRAALEAVHGLSSLSEIPLDSTAAEATVALINTGSVKPKSRPPQRPADQDPVVVEDQRDQAASPRPLAPASLDGHGDESEALSARPDEPLDKAPPLIWNPPQDQVSEVQDAVTVFERALIVFIKWRLTELHGEGWLRKGCGPYRKVWREKLERQGVVEPDSLLGAAEIGDLKDIIIMKSNWAAFRPYFPGKDWVKAHFEQIIPLRISGMHAGERTLLPRDFMGPFGSMIEVLNRFHTASATTVEHIFWDTSESEESETTFSRVITNLASIPSDPHLVGREDEERALDDFWEDPYQRVLSITGHGGVGKTALLDSFVHRLLSRKDPSERRPDVEVFVYLTAKTEWLEEEAKVPADLTLKDLESVCAWAIDIMGGARAGDESLDELKRRVYDQASELPILFALDNLESLDDAEVDALNTFLTALPQHSKAILTTRDDMHVGEKLNLEGLPPPAALGLLIRKLEELGIQVDLAVDEAALAALIDETSGVPIYVLHCANIIAHGQSASETLQYIRGRGMLKLMEFSFETSISSLSEAELGLLYFLALSRTPQSRKRMKELFADDDEINAGIRRLLQLSFIQREGRQVSHTRWVVATRQIRDYAKKRGNDLLPAGRLAAIAAMAQAKFEAARSTRVAEAISKVISEAAVHGRYDPELGLKMLEDGRREFGDDPRLLEEMGYRCFRLRRREDARRHLLNAEAAGYESASLFRTLALVEFFEGHFQDAQIRAEAALTISPDDNVARQLLGEALIERAKRQRLILDGSQRRSLVEAGRTHIIAARFSEARGVFQTNHNLRSDDYVREADQLLS